MDNKQMIAYMKMKNNLQIKNMKKFQSAFQDQTQLNSMENNDLDTTQIRLLKPEKEYQVYGNAKYTEDFKTLMQKYIPDNNQLVDIVNRIMNMDPYSSVPGQQYIKEFVLNFDSYQPILKKLEGQHIDKNLLVEKIMDAIAPNIIRKERPTINNTIIGYLMVLFWLNICMYRYYSLYLMYS